MDSAHRNHRNLHFLLNCLCLMNKSTRFEFRNWYEEITWTANGNINSINTCLFQLLCKLDTFLEVSPVRTILSGAQSEKKRIIITHCLSYRFHTLNTKSHPSGQAPSKLVITPIVQ